MAQSASASNCAIYRIRQDACTKSRRRVLIKMRPLIKEMRRQKVGRNCCHRRRGQREDHQGHGAAGGLAGIAAVAGWTWRGRPHWICSSYTGCYMRTPASFRIQRPGSNRRRTGRRSARKRCPCSIGATSRLRTCFPFSTCEDVWRDFRQTAPSAICSLMKPKITRPCNSRSSDDLSARLLDDLGRLRTNCPSLSAGERIPSRRRQS